MTQFRAHNDLVLRKRLRTLAYDFSFPFNPTGFDLSRLQRAGTSSSTINLRSSGALIRRVRRETRGESRGGETRVCVSPCLPEYELSIVRAPGFLNDNCRLPTGRAVRRRAQSAIGNVQFAIPTAGYLRLRRLRRSRRFLEPTFRRRLGLLMRPHNIRTQGQVSHQSDQPRERGGRCQAGRRPRSNLRFFAICD